MNQHASIEDLLAYVNGELSADTARALFEHAVACTECGDELATLLALHLVPTAHDSEHETPESRMEVMAAACT